MPLCFQRAESQGCITRACWQSSMTMCSVSFGNKQSSHHSLQAFGSFPVVRSRQTTHNLTSVQAKRTNVGIALITSPRVLFLDEPTSGKVQIPCPNLCLPKPLHMTSDGPQTLVISSFHSRLAVHSFQHLDARSESKARCSTIFDQGMA